MSELKIFYSWQSDLPGAETRSFIQNVLEKVAKEIRKDNSLAVEPVVDRDTLGVAGTPNIIDEILKKIDDAAVVVSDVSIINGRSRFRATPNPNVMFELGYALKTIGWNRVILVVNEAFGVVDKLPFDLPKRRAITYSLAENQDRTEPKLILHGKLKAYIEQILNLAELESNPVEESPKDTRSKAERIAEQQLFESKRRTWRISREAVDHARSEVIKLYEEIQNLFAADGEHNRAIGNECNRGVGAADMHLSLVYRGVMAFNLSWQQVYANDMDSSGLLLEIRKVSGPKVTDRTRIFRADIGNDEELVWFDEKKSDKRFSTEELAANLYDEFLDEIARPGKDV